MTNFVYIGTSLDGYISSVDGSLDWMDAVPNPEGSDLGFNDFMAGIDAVVMGRNTFETVAGFGLGWHYQKPGIILSASMKVLPEGFAEHCVIDSGAPEDVLARARQNGFENFYIDGGITIQRFLANDLIDEMIITDIPILLGGGDRLFGQLNDHLLFELAGSEVLLGHLVKKHYRRAQVN